MCQFKLEYALFQTDYSGFPQTRMKPSGSVSPSVDIKRILELWSMPSFLRISKSSLHMWESAPRLTAPDSPDITRGSSVK